MTVKQLKKLIADVPDDATVVLCLDLPEEDGYLGAAALLTDGAAGNPFCESVLDNGSCQGPVLLLADFGLRSSNPKYRDILKVLEPEDE